MDIAERTSRLTVDEARHEWRRIRARQPMSRQESYLPVEIVMCLSLFRILRPNSYGGANMDTVPTEVKILASTLVRTPGSIISKMLNLNGSRENGASGESQLFRLLQSPEKLEPLHKLVITAARAEGLEEAAVPDILTGRSMR